MKEAQAVAYNRKMRRPSGRFEISLLFAMLSFGASLAIIVIAPALRVLPGISEAQTTTDWSLGLLVVSLLSFLSSVSIRKWLRPPTSSKLERYDASGWHNDVCHRACLLCHCNWTAPATCSNGRDTFIE